MSQWDTLLAPRSTVDSPKGHATQGVCLSTRRSSLYVPVRHWSRQHSKAAGVKQGRGASWCVSAARHLTKHSYEQARMCMMLQQPCRNVMAGFNLAELTTARRGASKHRLSQATHAALTDGAGASHVVHIAKAWSQDAVVNRLLRVGVVRRCQPIRA